MTGAGKLVAALTLLLAVLGLSYGPWATHQQGIGEALATTAYNAVIGQQKATAGKLLQAETDRADVATTALADFKTEREKQDDENQSTIDTLAARLRTAAGAAGQLRDPNATAAGCGGGGAGAPGADPARAGGGAGDGATDSGLLSKQLTEFLLSQAADADDINVAYTSCRADALNLRGVLK